MRWDRLPDKCKINSSVGGGLPQPKNKKNKYNNQKPVVDGHKFDSKLEANVYTNLMTLQKGGEIKSIELQPKYRLQDGFDDKEGKHHRPINYFADFEITWKDNTVEVIDVKGYKTAVYKLKKKLFLHKYPNINFREITKKDFKVSSSS